MAATPPKPPFWFRFIGWICTRLGIVIWLSKDQADYHWIFQLYKPRKEAPDADQTR